VFCEMRDACVLVAVLVLCSRKNEEEEKNEERKEISL
jgi:hypothetical protein